MDVAAYANLYFFKEMSKNRELHIPTCYPVTHLYDVMSCTDIIQRVAWITFPGAAGVFSPLL